MVRTSGCNLRCSWCDTEYAFSGGETLSVDAIVKRVEAYPTRRVELTGGEPLLQAGIPKLARRFLDLGYTVLCETSGERDISVLPEGVHRIVDVKPPGSGEVEKNRWENLEHLNDHDEVKFVCVDRADFDWSIDVVDRYNLLDRVTVNMSPVYASLSPTELAEWILASGRDIRLNLQLHKALWGDEPGR